MDAESAPQKSVPRKLANAAQWIVFAFTALLAIVLTAELGKLDAPGAPVTQTYIALAVAVLLAAAHLPIVFRRMPRAAKWLAYLAILPSIALFGITAENVRVAYERTPDGAKEAAARAAEEKAAQAVQARKDAADKAVRDRAEADAAIDRAISLDQQRKELCDSLQTNVIAMSKNKLAFNVIEINDIQVGYGSDEKTLKCTGSAVTTNGNRGITFGIETTPQGKELLTYELD